MSGGNVADPGAEAKRSLLHVEFKTQEGLCPVCNGDIPGAKFANPGKTHYEGDGCTSHK